MKYDSVCLQGSCFKSRSSFFEYDHTNVHIANSHHVMSIHPLTFASFFPKSEASSNSKICIQAMRKEILKAKENALETVVQAVRAIFADAIMPSFEQSLHICEDLCLKTMVGKMSLGNYVMLEQLMHFEQQKSESNFGRFLQSSVKNSQEEVLTHLENTKKSLLQGIQMVKILNNPSKSAEKPVSQSNTKVIPDFQYKPFELKPFQFQSKKPLFQLPPKTFSTLQHKPFELKPYSFEINAPIVKEQYVPQGFMNESDFYKMKFDEEDEQDEIEEGEQEPSKNDMILFPKNMKKPRKARKTYNIADDIQALNNEELIVKDCRHYMKTIFYMHMYHRAVTTLHIFSEKLASKLAIKTILTNLPNIQKITFNCYFEFEPEVLSEDVSKEVLARLKLQLKWDMGLFFSQYFAYQHFPCKSIRRRQRRKKVQIDDLLKYLPNNHSIWIYDNDSLDKLDRIPLFYDNILTLHYQFSQKGSFVNFLFPKQYKSIRVLTLKNIEFCSSIKDFDIFCKQNEFLKTVVISQCTFLSDQLNLFLSLLQPLRHLTKLAISFPKIAYLYIDPEEIFKLVHLTHLHLDKCNFRRDPLFGIINFRGLNKLTKLQHLSLYGCKVDSTLLGFVYFQCFQSITYLNLGHTFIEQGACQHLRKFTNLKYLNLDHTRIEGPDFLDVCRSIQRQSLLDSTLKHLSLENQFLKADKKLNTEQLKDIAKCFPKLIYLNIAFNENVLGYNFAEFKGLKTIAVDKDQYEKLENILSNEVTRWKISQTGQSN